MRRAPEVVVGIVSALLAFSSPALLQAGTYDEIPFHWSFFAVLIYSPFLLAILGGAVAAFRGIWAATQRDRIATELALGRTRRRLVAQHVRDGALAGVSAGGLGILAGGLVRQLVTGFSGARLDSTAVWTWLSILALAVVSVTAAYWLVALWVTRGSVRDIASGHAADARGEVDVAVTAARAPGTARERRSPARILGWIAAALIACGAVMLGLDASGMTLVEEAEGVTLVALWIPAALGAAGIYLALPAVLVYWAARLAAWATRLCGRWLAAGAAGSARALAADGLMRPTAMRTVALGAIVMVMGAATAISTTAMGLEARNERARDLKPQATISVIDIADPTAVLQAAPSGWVSQALPRDLHEELHADERIEVVDAGVLLTDRRTVADGDDASTLERDAVLAVDEGAFDDIAAHGAKPLYLTGGMLWPSGQIGHMGWYGDGSYLEANGRRVTVQTLSVATPFIGIERGWAEQQWGISPTSAALLYPRDGVSIAAVLADYDTTDLETTRVAPAAGPASTLGASWTLLLVAGPFLLVAVAIVIALARASQRTRAHDHATMAALGARASALRGATAIEAAVTTLVGAALGVAGGALLGVALSAVFSGALLAVPVGPLVWNAGFDLAQVPWAAMAILVVVAVAAAAGGAAVSRSRSDRLTPAEQLAEAQRAGIS